MTSQPDVYVPSQVHIDDVTELRRIIAEVRDEYDGDPEAAHGSEDSLKSRVLRLVAEGHPLAREFAAEVLVMGNWDVTRWYA